MSRLTGAEAYGLMEAYNSVYAPQELTEEQVWEEVENWVNNLLEEGYDLSDYTWEQMYESYINEAAVNLGGNAAVNRVKSDMASQAQSDDKLSALRQQRFGGSRPTSSGQYRSSISAPSAKPPIENGRPESRFAGARDAAIAKARQIKGSPVVGSKPVATTPAATTKPAAGAPPKPAAGTPPKSAAGTPPKSAVPTTSATAKPAATPATKPAAPSFERRLPTSAELRAAQEARKSALEAGKSKPDAEAAAVNAGVVRGQQQAKADAIVKSGAVAALKPAGTATPRNGFGVDARKLAAQSSVNSSFDLFDVVLGHLLDEGYANTEEAALVIMSNMSEEWRESIIEDYKEFPTSKVTRKAGKLMGTKDPKKTKRGIKMMDTMMQHTPD